MQDCNNENDNEDKSEKMRLTFSKMASLDFDK